MELQEKSKNIIKLLKRRLTPLFKSFNVQLKVQESYPTIFAEYLIYKTGAMEFKITVCLHPHDYPYSLSIQYIDKSQSPWKYVNQTELLDIVQKRCAMPKSDLLIVTDMQIISSIEDVYEIAACIFK